MSLINFNQQRITGRGLNPNTLSCNDNAIGIDNTNFKIQIIAAIAGGNAMLPMNPGFELHPYKGQLTFTNQSKIIIGTFPPISYLIDSIKQSNPAIILNTLSQPTAPHQQITPPSIPFFHGNISALWGVLLTPAELGLLNAQLAISRQAAKIWLINFLTNKEIYYDDIILSTQRRLGNIQPHGNLGYTYEDKNLMNICSDINLVQQLLNNTKLDVVCFTNGATFRSGNEGGLKLYAAGVRLGLVRTGKSDALSLFLRTCQDLGLHIEMRCMPYFDWTALNQLTIPEKRTKLIFELRLTKTAKCQFPSLQAFTQKEFTAITPYSPSAHGNIEAHPIVMALRQVYGQNQTAAQLLTNIYNHLRNNTYHELFLFNINQ